MKNILLSIVELQSSQAAAVQAVADHVTAIKETLKLHYPELANDLQSQIEVEQRKSRESVQSLLLQTSKLKEMIQGLPN